MFLKRALAKIELLFDVGAGLWDGTVCIWLTAWETRLKYATFPGWLLMEKLRGSLGMLLTKCWSELESPNFREI